MRIRFLSLLLLPTLWAASLQAREVERTDSLHVYFYQGKSDFDPSYADNGARLHALQEQFGAVEIEKVIVSADTSPEGPAEVNRRLAQARAESIASYLETHFGVDPGVLAIEVGDDSWSRLETLVDASGWEQKDSALVLIRRHRDDAVLAQENRRIRNYLYVCFYPELRSATIVYRYTAEEAPETEPSPETVAEPAPEIDRTVVPAGQAPEAPVQESARNAWYLKTNFLTWPLLVPNIGAEFEIGNHFSVSVPFYYGAADWFSDDLKFRVLGTQPEIRYWLHDGFLGPFVALHATFAWYNIALGGDWRYQDHDRSNPTFGGGLTLGYKVPLGGRWGMEFSLGGGYLPLWYDRFYNVKNGLLADTQYKNYIGIDHAGITLTYRFD